MMSKRTWIASTLTINVVEYLVWSSRDVYGSSFHDLEALCQGIAGGLYLFFFLLIKNRIVYKLLCWKSVPLTIQLGKICEIAIFIKLTFNKYSAGIVARQEAVTHFIFSP